MRKIWCFSTQDYFFNQLPGTCIADHKPPDPVVNQGGFGPLSFKLRVSWLPKLGVVCFNRALLHASIHAASSRVLELRATSWQALLSWKKCQMDRCQSMAQFQWLGQNAWVFKKYEQSWYAAHCIEVSRWVTSGFDSNIHMRTQTTQTCIQDDSSMPSSVEEKLFGRWRLMWCTAPAVSFLH